MEDLFLGIDAGTTKIKAVVFDSKGKELKVAHNLPHPNYSEDGLVTQNMESHWNIAAETIGQSWRQAGSTERSRQWA